MEKVRWGILGTGNIAGQFCAGVNASRRGVLAAVGSRQLQSARSFATVHAIPVAHASYDSLVSDPSVDVVYNSLPNSLHHEWSIKALRAGKHVLCEKPLAMNASQAREMFEVAAKSGRLLMEAFMYRTHPLTIAVQAAVAGGAIGRLRVIRTSFCYRTQRIEGNVRFVPELGGGGLMDIGCYCINYSRMLAGAEPLRVHAAGQFHSSGVDELVSGTMLFPGNIMASFTCGMCVQANNTAFICGDEGYIEVPIPWKPPAQRAEFVITRGIPPKMDDKSAPQPPPREVRYVDAGLDLFGVEADDFAASILDGMPQRISVADSIGNMTTIDEMSKQICKSS